MAPSTESGNIPSRDGASKASPVGLISGHSSRIAAVTIRTVGGLLSMDGVLVKSAHVGVAQTALFALHGHQKNQQ